MSAADIYLKGYTPLLTYTRAQYSMPLLERIAQDLIILRLGLAYFVKKKNVVRA